VSRPPDSHAPDLPAKNAPLTPGTVVAGGRYRLLERVGEDKRVHASFWRAKDSVLDRDVAITALTGPDAARSLQAAGNAGRLAHPGIAWLLDIIDEPSPDGATPQLTGLIVSEWVQGADLASVAADAAKTRRTLSTAAIARALSPLADAVDAAHRAGLVLGCDHPHRIRIGNDGLARLAFPAASATGQPADDVRGLGAALYLLLTGRWPLRDAPPGVPAAPTSSTGVALPPQSLRPMVSPTLATLAERCLEGAAAGGVYSGAAVHHLLEQVSNAEADTMHIPKVRDDPGLYQEPDRRRDPDPHRRRKLAIALTVLAIAILGLFGWIGNQLISFIASDAPSSAPTLVVTPSGTPQPGQPAQPAPSGGPIQPAGVKVFNVTGDPDNPNRVSRVVDGNPRSSWKTFDYNQPFPALKSGVGVLVSFAEPVAIAAVHVDSPSEGSTIEVRTAPAGDAGLAGSAVLGSATLGNGRTEIALNQAPRTQQILVWITGLAVKDGKNTTELAELTFLRAA